VVFRGARKELCGGGIRIGQAGGLGGRIGRELRWRRVVGLSRQRKTCEFVYGFKAHVFFLLGLIWVAGKGWGWLWRGVYDCITWVHFFVATKDSK